MGEDREQDRARAWLALSLAHTFLHTSTRCTQNKRIGHGINYIFIFDQESQDSPKLGSITSWEGPPTIREGP